MVPTYDRPQMLQTFVDTALDTASNPSELLFTIMTNVDDHSYDDWMSKWPLKTDHMIEETIEPNLSRFYNDMYNNTKYKDDSILVSMVGDDMEFRTGGWDKTILDTANDIDGIGIISCNDDYISKGEIPVNLFTSRRYVDACGPYFMCPDFKRFWIDTIWGDVAKATDTYYYLYDVHIFHNHTSSKIDQDDTYKRLEEIGSKELVGGIEVAKNRIWSYVNKSVKNLQKKGLV